MDAINGFMQKYNAVPADNRGPQWHKASTVALMGWFRSYRAIVLHGWHREQERRATPEERAAIRPLFVAICREWIRREKTDQSVQVVAAAIMSVHHLREIGENL